MTTLQDDKQGTRILFDLNDILTPDEVERFKQSAEESGAESLTDHLLNITLRVPGGIPDSLMPAVGGGAHHATPKSEGLN